MEKIDRLGWTGGMAFTAYGVRVGVRANNAAALSALPRYLPPDWKPAPSPVVERLYSLVVGGEGRRRGVRNFNLLYGDHFRLARSVNLEEVYERLESDVQLYVAERARARVFVHAGVVGWRGRAVIVPGRSFSGKTSLVAALVRAGAVYYSDEYAVLDARGRVHPFPKPLAVRDEGTTRQKKFEVEELGGVAGKKALPIGLVVITNYKSGAKWRPQKLSAGSGLLAMLSNAVAAQSRTRRVLATLGQTSFGAEFVKTARGEASEAARLILKYLDNLPQEKSDERNIGAARSTRAGRGVNHRRTAGRNARL